MCIEATVYVVYSGCVCCCLVCMSSYFQVFVVFRTFSPFCNLICLSLFVSIALNSIMNFRNCCTYFCFLEQILPSI